MAHHPLDVDGYDGSSYKIGIVTGQFNEHITDPMLEHCIETLQKDFKVPSKSIVSVRVAGTADAPAILSSMAGTEKYDALIVMGAVIRGETAHFDYVNALVTQAVADTQVRFGIPVTFGVIMCTTQSQAKNRIILGKEYAAATMQSIRARATAIKG